jgi:hypothetical protein
VAGVLVHTGIVWTCAQVERNRPRRRPRAGSVNVASYAIVSFAVRVKRSTSFSDGVEPRGVIFRLAVSTTSVVPSQWPREAPMYERIDERSRSRCAGGSIGMTRVS